MKKTPKFLEFNYARLLSDLSTIQNSIKDSMERSASTILLQGYWKMGERLCQEQVIRDYQKTDSGFILSKLAEGLNVEYSLLTRIIKLYKIWPQKEAVVSYGNLSWSHFKKLMTIKDEEERNFYLEECNKNRWNKLELIYRVKSHYFEAFQAQGMPLSTTLKRGNEKLYLYAGKIVKIVDGDTLLVAVDLGFNVKIDVRLRLRGINAPELKQSSAIGVDSLDKSEGFLAKEFIEQRLEYVDIVIFQSFKVDLYGRYVADIYYLPGETNKEKIFEQGRYLNQDLVDAGFAKIL